MTLIELCAAVRRLWLIAASKYTLQEGMPCVKHASDPAPPTQPVQSFRGLGLYSTPSLVTLQAGKCRIYQRHFKTSSITFSCSILSPMDRCSFPFSSAERDSIMPLNLKVFILSYSWQKRRHIY